LMVQEILRGQGYLTLAVTGGGNMSKAQAFWRGFVAFDDRPGSVAAQKHRLLSLLDRYGDVDQPRFILFHTYEIHSPYAAPPRYNRMFGRPQSSFEPTSENLLEYVNTAKRALAPADLEHIEARYDAEIRFTDDVLRQIFAQLGERGVLDDAIVIITADHGEEFGEHGGLMHRAYLYDELIHVPLIMWGHGRVPPRVDDRMVSSVDIAPTILAAAGAATPEAMAGRDLLAPAPVADLDDAVFSQYGRSRYAIRTRRWKLIVNPPPRGPELYDLEHDPGERSNLAPAQPHTVERLRRRLDAWRSGLSTLGGAPEQVDLTAAERERLEALGYVE
ncbi:MAG: sulfatase-like hydrolase/transferase, partial [Planctomycetota bacterium]|nr:sulfatase-like hydrolase/transferase [Planctomycetota bacterium]